MERSLYLTSTSEIPQAEEVTPAQRGQLVHKVQPAQLDHKDLLDPPGRRERRAHKDLLDRRAPLVLRVLPEALERSDRPAHKDLRDRRALPALKDLLEPLARSDQPAHKDLPDRRARPALRDLLALSDPRARKVPLDSKAQPAQ
jgi:hypothetical protein